MNDHGSRTVRDELLDRLELRQLVENYAAGADRRDGQLVASSFLPDGHLMIFDEGANDAPTREIRGRENIATAIGKLVRYEATMHFLGQQMVEIDGDDARGETYCRAHHVSTEDGERTDRVMAIRYLDAYRRVDGRWFIKERRLMNDWVEVRPLVTKS